MMIDGWGVAVDRVISDFVQGTVEWMLEEGEERGDWIIVEGQGSLDHPAYSSVTLGLIHGSTPHAMVMVHKPGPRGARLRPPARTSRSRSRSCPEFIRLHETVAGLVAPSKVVAVALNTMLYPSDDDARRVIEEIAAETGLPTDDPVRFGADRLWPAIREAVDALPWVKGALPDGSAPAHVTLSFRHEVLHLGLRDPFLIARTDHGGGHAVTTVVDRAPRRSLPGHRRARRGLPRPVLRRDGRDHAGRAAAAHRRGRGRSSRRPTACARRATGSQDAIRWNGAAKCALDSALHDLVGKVTGQPVHRLLGLSTDIPPTDFTLGLDEPAVVAERARRAGAFPALKIKVGGPADLATLEAVREVYDKPIRVDANTGWTPETARQLLPGARRPRGRAHRAAVPRRAARLACATSRRARRCRSSRTSRA